MEDKADVGLVDAHAESIGSHHDLPPVILEVLLTDPALLLIQPRVIAGGREAPALQLRPDLFHIGAGGAVDDAAAAPALLQQGQQLRELLPGPPDVEEQIGAVKARHDPHRRPEVQLPDHVLLDLGGSRGGKSGQHGPPGQSRNKGGNLQIAGAEILPPLGDAVGFVHRHQGDLQRRRQLQEPLVFQALRGDVQQTAFPPADPAPDLAGFLQGLGAVEEACGDARRLQGRDLVLHQRDQRGNDQRHPRQQQGGDLIAEGFPAAGGHDAQSVPP